MLALRFHAPNDVRLEDAPEPTPAADEVKIRVRNCSTCGTDVKIRANGHPNLSPPRTIGHEIAGEIVEIGADVAGGALEIAGGGLPTDPAAVQAAIAQFVGTIEAITGNVGGDSAPWLGALTEMVDQLGALGALVPGGAGGHEAVDTALC